MSRRRRTKDRGPCALVSALRGPVDELGEPVAAALRRARVERPRFDPAGRRLARIHSTYRPRRGAEPGKVLPMVRLSGKWLREAGFPVGRRFSVEVEDGELVIRAL